MPKTKNLESDSDSDSGPEDRNPAKKAKTEGGSSSSSGLVKPKQTNDGESYWDLGRNKRVTVRTFKGSIYVDIREFYEKDGKTLPGKKGVSLKAGDWGLLKDLVDSVDQAVKEI